MHNDVHKRQRFSSRLHCEVSPSVCVAVVTSLTGEMAAQSLLTMLMEQHSDKKFSIIHGLCAIRKH